MPKELLDSGDVGSTADAQGLIDLIKSKYSRAAVTLRFSDDHVDVVSAVQGDDALDIDHGDNEVVDLPDSTVFAMSMAGGGDAVARSWDDTLKAARAVDAQIDDQLSQFERQTGFDLPTDLETLLGDNILFAVDRDGLSPAAISSGGPGSINAGARFTGDKAKLDALYDKITGADDGPGRREDPVLEGRLRPRARRRHQRLVRADARRSRRRPRRLAELPVRHRRRRRSRRRDVLRLGPGRRRDPRRVGQFGAPARRSSTTSVRSARSASRQTPQGDYTVSHLVLSVDD